MTVKRLPGFPSVPTVGEAGYPGLEVAIWIGLFAPKGTPPAIVERINAAVKEATIDPDVVRLLNDAAINVRSTSTTEFTAYVAAQYQRWGQFATEVNLKQQ